MLERLANNCVVKQRFSEGKSALVGGVATGALLRCLAVAHYGRGRRA